MAALLLAELRRIATRRLVRVTVLLTVVGIALGRPRRLRVQRLALRRGVTSSGSPRRRLVRSRRTSRSRPACASTTSAAVARSPRRSQRSASRTTRPLAWTIHASPATASRGSSTASAGRSPWSGWALGASLVGAEFASRGMTTLLTWEPRRARVFAAKTVAVVGAMAVFAAAALALVALAMWPALALHGAPLRTGRSLALVARRHRRPRRRPHRDHVRHGACHRHHRSQHRRRSRRRVRLHHRPREHPRQLRGAMAAVVAAGQRHRPRRGRERRRPTSPAEPSSGPPSSSPLVAVTLLVAAATSFRARDLA